MRLRARPKLEVVLAIAAVLLFGCKFLQPHPITRFVLSVKSASQTSQSPGQQALIVKQVIQVLSTRLSEYGISGFSIHPDPTAQDRIILDLPITQDIDSIQNLVTQKFKLELKFVHSSAPFDVSSSAILECFGGKLPDGYESVQYQPYQKDPDHLQEGGYILVESLPIITGKDVCDARASQSAEYGQPIPIVSFKLNPDGADRFGKSTIANIGRRLAIVISNVAVSAPVIQSKITESGQITGIRSAKEAEVLAASLRSGDIPADVVVLEIKDLKK